ncbi:MAG TPA: ABC transporter substrate-binding protein [Gammaproteobacteria bacterium]
MSEVRFTAVSRTQGNNAALKDGTVVPKGFALDFIEVPVLVQAFRRMVRGLEFDICEMALTTFLCAREHGVRFTALPVFLVRAFHHGAIVVHRNSGIDDPKQLEGRRVAVGRGYTVTTGVWARSILADEYGVDLGRITWVLTGDEHVEAYQPPPNVVPLEPGATIEEQLKSGELAAAVNVGSDDPDIRPLIPEALEAGIAAFRRSGHYPINHLVVVRDDVLEAHPDLAVALFEAFTESKRLYLERLRSGDVDPLTDPDRLHLRMLEYVDDPLPYGLEPNRRVLESLIGHAMSQQILRKPVAIESLFAPTTVGLTG